MKLKFHIALIFVLGLVSVSSLRAQTCSDRLNQARILYTEGKLVEVIDLLEPCLSEKNTFSSPQERTEAFRLSALANIFQDYEGEALTNMESLLRHNPLYKIDPLTEPAEYTALYNRFRVLPLISVGVHTGIGYTFPILLRTFTPGNQNVKTGRYRSTIGFRTGASFDLLLKKQAFLSLGYYFHQKRLAYEDQIFDFTQVNYNENLFYIDLPVSIKYEFGDKKFIPFVRGGINLGFLLASQADIVRSFPEAPVDDLEGNNLNTRSQRHGLDWNPMGGIGVGYRIGQGRLIFETRFHLAMTNITRGENRYADDRQLFEYFYIHDDLGLNNISFSLGYNFTFYHIRRNKSNE